METKSLRKERIGVVTSNKMDKTITVAVKNTLSMVNLSIRRKNTMLMTKRTSATSAIPSA